MTQSMTGFASTIIDIPMQGQEKLSLVIHLKSLNARYFETTCKLPYLLTNLEVMIHRILKKKLERGHIYLTVKIQHDTTKHVVIPALSTIQEYMQAIKIIQKTCNIKENISLEALLQLPNILEVEEKSLNNTTEEKILKVIEKLTDDLIKTRISEGKTLAQDIANHIGTITKKLSSIQKTSEKVIAQKKKELDEALSELRQATPNELLMNTCLLENQKNTLLSDLEKIDIHEEIVRAKSHVKNILQHLKDNTLSKGKKLDFMLQELNREINTIASKCSHSSISSLTIDIKTDVEKAREQTQNIL